MIPVRNGHLNMEEVRALTTGEKENGIFLTMEEIPNDRPASSNDSSPHVTSVTISERLPNSDSIEDSKDITCMLLRTARD